MHTKWIDVARLMGESFYKPPEEVSKNPAVQHPVTPLMQRLYQIAWGFLIVQMIVFAVVMAVKDNVLGAVLVVVFLVTVFPLLTTYAWLAANLANKVMERRRDRKDGDDGDGTQRQG